MAGIEPTMGGRGRVYWYENNTKHSTQTMTLEECQAWIDEHHPDSQRITLAWLLDAWAESRQESDYAQDVRHQLAQLFLQRSWTMPGSITLDQVERWNVEAGGKGLIEAGRGVSRSMQYLLGLLRWAKRRHGVKVSQAVIDMAMPRRPRKPSRQLLTIEQVAAIRIESLDVGQRAAALIDYLLAYGARPKTACLLRQADLSLHDGRWFLTIDRAKHSGGWRHPVRDREVELWQSLALPSAGGDGPLFPHWREDRAWRVERGRAAEVANWYKNCIGKRIDLPPTQNTIYRLKDYAMTGMLGAGLDPATVALFTGHRDKGQVLTYNRTSAQRATEALARLDAGLSLVTSKS